MQEWRNKLRHVTPYVPGEQPDEPDMIKLNTNENPYPPSERVAAVSRGFDTDCLRLYPDPTSGDLVKALADYYRLDASQVFVGVGSDDVLATAFMTFFASEQPVLFPDITYSFYDVWAELFRIPYRTVPLDDSLRIRREDYYAPNGGIVLANPNAPTGIYENNGFIEDIVRHNRNSIVIVDEAYIDFAPESALPLLEKYENLVIIRTFSKSRSMAGMRIGFALAGPELIRAMNDVKYSYNSYTMNTTALRYGVAAIQDETYFREALGRVIATRERAKKRLGELGFVFPDSQTNFIFAKHSEKSAQEIFEALKRRHIYVRHFNKARIDGYLRITIGTDEQMEQVYQALAEIVAE